MKKILVVEDTKKNLNAAKDFFSTIKGIEVIYAIDCVEALIILESEKPCAVLTDMCMPLEMGSGDYDEDFGKLIKNFVMADKDEAHYLKTGMSISIEEYWKPLLEVFESGIESNMPHGLDIAERCQEAGIPFVFITSEHHHGKLLCGVHQYMMLKGWRHMIDELNKEEVSTWEKAYKHLKVICSQKGVELPEK